MDKLEIIQIAKDAIQHKVPNNYDANKTSESLRQAFIDANNGSTKFDIKAFRRHPELYDIIEEIIPVIIEEGFTGNEFFMNFVDFRNEALGDDTDFWVEENSLFIVSEASRGNQGFRRQRINEGSKQTIAKSLKIIKIYEELDRLLAGRVDFNTFVDRVGKSMTNHVYTDIYNGFNGISTSTTGMTSDYYKSGSYSESVLLTLIEHVEAAMNGTATILGTKSALRRVTTGVVAEAAKNDMYNLGYYGKFYSTPMIAVPQRHTVGTDTFILDDTKLYVVASNEKFIKMVYSGEGLLLDGDPTANADFSREYTFGTQYGVGVIISGRVGVNDLT